MQDFCCHHHAYKGQLSDHTLAQLTPEFIQKMCCDVFFLMVLYMFLNRNFMQLKYANNQTLCDIMEMFLLFSNARF